MLVQKAISTKKLAISVAIILFMISGTGFMLYQNKKLTTNKPTNVNAPMVFNNAVTGAVTPVVGAPATGAAAGTGQALDMSKLNQAGGLNLSIFASDKFKNLRANTFLIKEPPEVGKRDPFKPN